MGADASRPDPSPSPQGCPIRLVQRIRELTNDGADLEEFALAVLDGNEFHGGRPITKERVRAAEWLAAYGFLSIPSQLLRAYALRANKKSVKNP